MASIEASRPEGETTPAEPQAAPPVTSTQPMPAGAAAPMPARRAPAGPGWTGRAAGPAVVLLTAALVVVASAWGSSLAGETRAEILAILGGGALMAAALLRAGDGRVPGGWPLAAFAALAGLTALSLLWAVNPAGAWLEANMTFAYLAAFAGTAALAHLARDRAGSLVGGLLLGVSIVCVLALLSKIAPEWLNEHERYARLREPFGYWNAVGLTGALGVPAALWLGSRREGAPLLTTLAFPALTLAITTILLAYSRGSLLAAAVGAAVWFALVPARRIRGAAVLLLSAAAAAFAAAWTFGQHALTEDRVELAERSAAGRELAVLLVAVLLLVYVAGMVVSFAGDLRPLGFHRRRGVAIALLVLLALTPAAVAGVLSSTDEGLGGSISTAWRTLTDPDVAPASNEPGRLTQTGGIRARYWDDAKQMLADRPVAGWGAAGFGTVRPRYRSDTLDVRHAHGYVAQTLSDLGAIGMAISLALLAAWLIAARLALRRTPPGPVRNAIATLAAVAIVFGVHSLVDWTWFTVGTALVGMLAAGFVAGAVPSNRTPPARPWSRNVRYGAAALALLLAGAGAWSAGQPLRADSASDGALAAADAQRYDEARADARRASRINPLSPDPLLALASIERRAGDIQAAEDALNEAVKVAPASASTWMRLAELQLWVQDDPQAALESVRAALYLDPSSLTVIQRYLDISRTLRNRQGAGG